MYPFAILEGYICCSYIESFYFLFIILVIFNLYFYKCWIKLSLLFIKSQYFILVVPTCSPLEIKVNTKNVIYKESYLSLSVSFYFIHAVPTCSRLTIKINIKYYHYLSYHYSNSPITKISFFLIPVNIPPGNI